MARITDISVKTDIFILTYNNKNSRRVKNLSQLFWQKRKITSKLPFTMTLKKEFRLTHTMQHTKKKKKKKSFMLNFLHLDGLHDIPTVYLRSFSCKNPRSVPMVFHHWRPVSVLLTSSTWPLPRSATQNTIPTILLLTYKSITFKWLKILNSYHYHLCQNI